MFPDLKQTLHSDLIPPSSPSPFTIAEESVLMDLKALLVEAKQKVPPVLQVLQTGDEAMLDLGGEPSISFNPC